MPTNKKKDQKTGAVYTRMMNAENGRFRDWMQHGVPVIHVPNRKGILIHSGNTVDHTRGCILVGTDYRAGYVLNSFAACEKLFRAMRLLDIKKIEVLDDF